MVKELKIIRIIAECSAENSIVKLDKHETGKNIRNPIFFGNDFNLPEDMLTKITQEVV